MSTTKYYLETPNHQLMIHAESLSDALRLWGMHLTMKKIVLPLDTLSLRVHYGRRDAGIDVPFARAISVLRPMVWQLMQLDIFEKHGEQALIKFCQQVNCDFSLGKVE